MTHQKLRTSRRTTHKPYEPKKHKPKVNIKLNDEEILDQSISSATKFIKGGDLIMSGNQGSGDGRRNGDSVWTSGDGTMHTSTPKPINLQH